LSSEAYMPEKRIVLVTGASSGVGSITPASSWPEFAVDGYTEALRHEVKPLNIQVSQIEVGFLRTAAAGLRRRPRFGREGTRPGVGGEDRSVPSRGSVRAGRQAHLPAGPKRINGESVTNTSEDP
jgi:NAD(P)-dependent dehydrogenase (short-subunit alcohol dehydrogenase family)